VAFLLNAHFDMPQDLTHTAFVWLRSALLRRVVAWGFLLAIGLANTSPLLKPQSMELLCGSGGQMKLQIKSAEGEAQASTHTVHCGLCASNALDGALPPATVGIVLQPQAEHAHPCAPLAAPIARSLPTLPARGPPDFS
jgi:hypothetical protein